MGLLLRRGAGGWSGQAGVGRRRKGKLVPNKDGAGKGKRSRAGEGRDGPTDEVRAPGRSEACQDMGRGETWRKGAA